VGILRWIPILGGWLEGEGGLVAWQLLHGPTD
jgi:hypothetical protein